MFEALKKMLFAGLGATVITGERLRAKLDELVQQGRISAKEAQEMAEKIMAEGRKEFEEGGARVSGMMDEMLRKANFARQKDLDALAARVQRLESLQGMGAPASSPPPAPGATGSAPETPPAAGI
jgi:polyhydroxyalkanoate synthesis regulator phasin